MTGIMCMMVGGGGLSGVVELPNQFPTSTAPGGASAVFVLDNTGNFSSTGDGAGPYATPSVIVANLEARLTFVSGNNLLTGSAVGSWLALSTTRSWALSATGTQLRIGTFTLEIREIASGLMRDTSTIAFEAESF